MKYIQLRKPTKHCLTAKYHQYILTDGWFTYEIAIDVGREHAELHPFVQWCFVNLGYYPYSEDSRAHVEDLINIYFRSQADAAMFKMKWL
jgi:hypothetical protein